MAKDTSKGFGTKKKFSSCRICGAGFSYIPRGRPKEYCSSDCRDYFKFYQALSDSLSKIKFIDLDHIKSVKSDLFCLANTLPKSIV